MTLPDHPAPAAATLRPDETPDLTDEPVFAVAAELFGLLATPVRLRILSALCRGDEKTVSQLQLEVGTTQPNLSQHLSTLLRAGILGRRSDASNRYYRIVNQQAALLCRTVCTQIAAELNAPTPPADPSAPRLAPRPRTERPRVRKAGGASASHAPHPAHAPGPEDAAAVARPGSPARRAAL